MANILKILVGVTPQERAVVMKDLLTKTKRDLRIVKGVATGEPVTVGDLDLFDFISEVEFSAIEKRCEFVHTERQGGARYGYRWADIERALNLHDALVVFDTFEEAVDRSALHRFRAGKIVVDREGKSVTLTLAAYGDMRTLRDPAN